MRKKRAIRRKSRKRGKRGRGEAKVVAKGVLVAAIKAEVHRHQQDNFTKLADILR